MCVCVRTYLWCALSLPDYIVQIVGDVYVQATGQVPGLTDPVVILSPETHTKTSFILFSGDANIISNVLLVH